LLSWSRLPVGSSARTISQGLSSSLAKGCDVDKPRNLAKSVTVE